MPLYKSGSGAFPRFLVHRITNQLVRCIAVFLRSYTAGKKDAE